MLHLSKFDCNFKCQVKNSNKDVASSSQFSQKNVSHIHSFSLLLFSFCLHSSSNFYSVTALSNNCFCLSIRLKICSCRFFFVFISGMQFRCKHQNPAILDDKKQKREETSFKTKKVLLQSIKIATLFDCIKCKETF